MQAELSIDFGNSYTKVGIRSHLNATSEPLKDQIGLQFDEDNICIPTVAAREVRNGKEEWLYGIRVKGGASSSSIQVFRNWKPRFFEGSETRLDEDVSEPGAVRHWSSFTNDQLDQLLRDHSLNSEKEMEVAGILKHRKTSQKREQEALDLDFEAIGTGFFGWLRTFVEPYCQVHKIGTCGEIPVRITLPSFGASSYEARHRLETILQKTGWKLADRQPALPEPVANLIGTFSAGRNVVWRGPQGNLRETCNIGGMFGGTSLFDAIRANALRDAADIYWVLIADIGGYTTDFAMVGFDVDNLNIDETGTYRGKRLLAHYSEPMGVHGLDRRLRQVLGEENRRAFDSLDSDVDGLRIDRFHQAVYQDRRAYDTGQGVIGRDPKEAKAIERIIQEFAAKVAEIAQKFLLIYQYDHIDELILTGGGCNVPLVRDAIREKLASYSLKNAHIPVSYGVALPKGCCKLERLLVRGATALGATSVFFDYN